MGSIELTSKFSERVREAMDTLDVTIKDLSRVLGVTYEHTRRLTRGISDPGELALKEICNTLSLDLDEMRKLVTEDKLRRKYGDIVIEMAGKDPTMERIERLWANLTAAQQDDLVMLAKEWVARNKVDGSV